MTEPEPPPKKTWREEPARAAMAFLLVFVLAMFVGVSVLAGLTAFEPRTSAMIVALPSAIAAAAFAAYGPTRRILSRW